MKESKPAIATADVELIRKVISYYIKHSSPPNKEVEQKLLNLFSCYLRHIYFSTASGNLMSYRN